ncbi:MAG: hypothetical protein C0601_10640 [Candidatus Muiribacterium halophilum]|uniref:Flagellar motor switch protein FliG C-terminal domain-containing protein n=1 Tax=Muiribacterium halophilum TaxID=2053465 RepID=A0A2N5ZC74_MUIH1|nr:MAG: hypothetical protein C0601_10640 [Candidatus Muirbacterium halophilum]
MIKNINEIMRLDNDTIQEALRGTDITEIANLFLLLSEPVAYKISRNLSTRAFEKVNEKAKEIGKKNADKKYIDSFLKKVNSVCS